MVCGLTKNPLLVAVLSSRALVITAMTRRQRSYTGEEGGGYSTTHCWPEVVAPDSESCAPACKRQLRRGLRACCKMPFPLRGTNIHKRTCGPHWATRRARARKRRIQRRYGRAKAEASAPALWRHQRFNGTITKKHCTRHRRTSAHRADRSARRDGKLACAIRPRSLLLWKKSEYAT